MSRAWLAGAVGLTLLGGCSKVSKEEELKEMVAAMPWMVDILESCQAFKQVKADAEKRDISRNVFRQLANAEVHDVRGEIEVLRPLKPGEFTIQIKLGKDVRFASSSKTKPLNEKSPVYGVLSSLEEGQCVVFSAKSFEPMATFDEGKVCIPRYYAEFTSLAPCPKS